MYSLALLVVGLVWFRAGTAVHISSIPRAASAFALPMLLDRRVDGVTAVVTSINAVLRNKPAMLVRSLLIEAAIAIGFATALVGLIVTMPVIAHAACQSRGGAAPRPAARASTAGEIRPALGTPSSGSACR